MTALQDKYLFVDNAQKLHDNPVCSVLHIAKGYCLAFSPVVAERRGLSIFNGPLKPTDYIYFCPFTSAELDEFFAQISKYEVIPKEHI